MATVSFFGFIDIHVDSSLIKEAITDLENYTGNVAADWLNPNYSKLQESLKDKAANHENFAHALLISSAVAFIYGVTCSSFLIGVSSVALGLVAYNLYRVSDNIAELSENPRHYFTNDEKHKIIMKKVSLNKLIRQNTVFFNFYTSKVVNDITGLTFQRMNIGF